MPLKRESLRQNLVWLGASLALASVVWLLATIQNDPVRQQVFSLVPVNVIQDEGMILANADALRSTVTVRVRARDSVLDLLSREDITVVADLSDLPPGSHTVTLETRIARQASADTTPLQLNVELVARQSQQKAVVGRVTNDLPTGYALDELRFSEMQVLVSGTAQQLARVDRLEARLDLSERRESFSQTLDLVPVDPEGLVVSSVDVAQDVTAEVTISRREDEQALPVLPVLDNDSLPDGYTARLGTYSPDLVSVQGPPSALSQLPEVLSTETIDLSERTASFTTSVAPVIDVTGVSVIDAGGSITVEVIIEPIRSQAQFDAVAVSFSGVNPAYSVRAIPSRVTVLVDGPQPLLDTLSVDDINVAVDVQDLQPGSYDRTPTASISIGDIPSADIRVLPSTIGIVITPQSEITPEVGPTPVAVP